MASKQVTIGTKVTHQSHTLAWKQGVWFCVACGAYAKAVEDHKSTVHKLSGPCPGSTNKGGQEALDRIQLNQPPRRGMEWPLSASRPAPSSLESLEELWPHCRRKKLRTGPGRQDDVRPALKRTRSADEGVEGKETLAKQQKYADVSSQGKGDPQEDQEDPLAFFNEDEDPWHENV